MSKIIDEIIDAETEQNSDVKKCVKIILNSLYGKFIQVSGDYNQTGRLFNPLYAAKITAGARLNCHDYCIKSGYSIDTEQKTLKFVEE